VATGLILLKLFGRRGPLGRLLHDTLDLNIIFTWRGVLVALGVMSFPLLVLSARIAFEQVNPRFEQVARTLGAGEARVFFTITLPLAWRGILGGMTLAFARALGEFGATIMVAGNIPGQTSTLSLSIYQHVQLGQDPRPIACSASPWCSPSSPSGPPNASCSAHGANMKATLQSRKVGRDSVEPKLDFLGKCHGSTESRPTVPRLH